MANQKKSGVLILAALAAAAVLAASLAGCMLISEGLSADPPAEPDRLPLKAWIDDQCQSHPAALKVPDRKTALDFKRTALEPGKPCKPGEPLDNHGFAIRDHQNRAVYVWSQYKNQPPYEKGGPLEKLALPPGEYTLTVAGGAGAKVELSYRLK